jgi:hypothetical protein
MIDVTFIAQKTFIVSEGKDFGHSFPAIPVCSGLR